MGETKMYVWDGLELKVVSFRRVLVRLIVAI